MGGYASRGYTDTQQVRWYMPRRVRCGSLSTYLGVEVCVVVQLLGLDGELVVRAEHLFDLLGEGARQGEW